METESKDGTAISDGTSLLASQNTTGSQKRQKKPTAPQVFQRMRPISKRKVSCESPLLALQAKC